MFALLFLALNAHASLDMREVDLTRIKILERGLPTRVYKEARQVGTAETFVGGELVTSLKDLESAGHNRGSVSKSPWSGHYWANENGGLGYRFRDPRFPKNWADGYNYIYYTSRWNQTYWDYFSPAEKYDYITGVDSLDRGSLTIQQWELGREEYVTTGKIADWQGICHGWAAASIYLPTPKLDVAFRFPQGELRFTVDDIKALGSLYYANAKYESVFNGWRCNEAKPATDAEGRVLDPKCFDVNPGDWHLALTNLVGMKKEPFILDASESLEVWNYPIVDYRITYFDPTNIRRQGNSYKHLARQRKTVRNLRFGQYRSPETVWVVGASSTITLGGGSSPGDNRNFRQTYTFTYDLELDENMNIIGGEWRDKSHPDFLWRKKGSETPTTESDNIRLDMWRLQDSDWKRAARMNNPKGIPVRLLVEELFRLSSGN